MVQHYELLFIISSSVDDRHHEPLVKKIQESIVQQGGRVTVTEEWGKRKLAYDIRHEKYGAYVLVEFDAESSLPKNLNATLKLMPELLRYQVLTKRVKTAQEVNAERMLREKIVAKRAAEQRVAAQEQAATAAPVEPPKPVSEEPKKETKISLEDLDKKLDEILKEEF
ncbi:MAG: 30S ribosomal protein S6 [Patescibacteria group bacterium]|nr:30S ribosomal protein S6 [Patescibacteria group bacterium]MDD5715818.1 30S ribosomal protein S6 [Patescibacteria group bacterium]